MRNNLEMLERILVEKALVSGDSTDAAARDGAQAVIGILNRPESLVDPMKASMKAANFAIHALAATAALCFADKNGERDKMLADMFAESKTLAGLMSGVLLLGLAFGPDKVLAEATEMFKTVRKKP